MSNRDKNKDCDHHVFVHSTMCKYCFRLQCDRCIREHLTHHVTNGDREMTEDEMEWK